tara:strand:- start:352 stop:2235 length:1884 start_codon:yes stop_codon:yes gene_type:complete
MKQITSKMLQAIATFNEGKVQEAERLFRNILKIESKHLKANQYLAISLQVLGRLDEAVTIYKKVLKLKPEFADAHQNLGNTLIQLERFQEAELSYRKFLELNPSNVEIRYNLGNTLRDLNKLQEAELSYRKVLELAPDYYAAHHNLAIVLQDLRKFDESLIYYNNTKALKPNLDYLLGSILVAKMNLAIWDDLPSNLREITKKIENEEKVSQPFPLFLLIDNSFIHKKSAEIFFNDKYPKSNIFPKIPKYHDHKKIKIGYFSADFRNHPVAQLTARLYEMHDRDMFEVHAFSFGIDTKDDLNLRIKAGVDHFHDIQTMSDIEIVKFSRSLEIDIAINLSGFTNKHRTKVFTMSVAPIQVSYLGYAGTMGGDFMNYLIADKTIIPEQNKKYYFEKIVYLPNSFMVNDSKIKLSEKKITRKEFGLPVDSFVFCSFNNTAKITPTNFVRWMRILKAVKNSVLWLSDTNNTTVNNLKNVAKKYGIKKNRLIFAPKLPQYEDHLNRIQLADLFIDTFPYNAHATASDTLRVGLPLLTYMGDSFPSRVAASLLNALDLPELIVTTEEQYETLAIQLAINPKKLKNIKEKLINNLNTTTLYNPSLFTKNLEAAYMIMHERYQKGLKLEDIEIKD